MSDTQPTIEAYFNKDRVNSSREKETLVGIGYDTVMIWGLDKKCFVIFRQVEM